MDELATGALTAIPFDDPDQARRWIERVVEVQRSDPAGERDALLAALAEESRALGLRDEQWERFTEYLDQHVADPVWVVAEIAAEPDPVGHYERAVAVDDQPDEPDQPEPDEAVEPVDHTAWFAFLAEHSRYWDGADGTWAQFRDWFAYQAEESGFAAQAADLLAYVEGADDRAAAMVECGGVLAEVTEVAEDGPAADPAILVRLAEFPDTEDGVIDFLSAELGVDIAALVAELERARTEAAK